MDEWGRPTTVEELDALIEQVPTSDDAYAVAWEVWGGTMGVAGTSEVGHALWLLWGGLTDWAEAGTDQEADAHEAMRRAATEWAAVKDDPAGRDRYFDHWLYESSGTNVRSDAFDADLEAEAGAGSP